MRRLAWLASSLALACFSDLPPGGGASESETGATETTGSPDTTGPSSTSGTSSASTDDPPPTSIGPETNDSSVETTADSGVECPDGTVRPPPAPAGWTGPFVLVGGDVVPPPCPEGLTDADVVRGDPSGTCSCNCDLECRFHFFEPTNGCSDLPIFDGSLVLGASCSSTSGHLALLTGDAAIGACSVPALGAPEIQWGFTHRLCTSEQDTCVPVPPTALGPCVRAEGDMGCPEGFDERVVTGTSVGEPACGPCSDCDTQAIAACAGASITTYVEVTCGNEVETQPAGVCTSQPNAAAGMLLTGVGPPACEPSQLQSGLDDPVTYCCL